MFGSFGMWELIIILLIVLLLFCSRMLPELATGLGKAIKNFKKATTEPDEIDVTPKKNIDKEEESKGEKKDKGE